MGGRVSSGDHQLVAGLHRPGGEAARDARRHGRRRREAVVVQHHAARMLPRDVPVREVPVHRGDAAGVLELAEVVERLEATPLAQLLLQAVEELRVLGLSPAALAEELPLQGVHRVDVVARPGSAGRVGRGQIGVDAGYEAVDVPQHGLALLAGALQLLGLLGDDRLGLRARLEALQAGDQPDRAQTGRVDGRDAGVVAGLLEQQPAVLGEDPAGGLNAAGVGRGVDVRDIESVTQQRDPGERDALLRGRPVRVDAELLGLEVGEQVVRADAVEERRERVVHLRLGRGVRGRSPVLAGGKDVPGDDRAVLGERTRAGPRCEHRDNANGDQDTSHPAHLSSLSSPGALVPQRSSDANKLA